ncbi:MAG: hypothetical protein HC903_19140 [Methylacidiphilales bacterium]|nr:hypothetical protein [Candidatus Methylacidiphilales bacterium]NJR14365.1 hypothetical protein [Calothrix sp. CSU_2_0]
MRSRLKRSHPGRGKQPFTQIPTPIQHLPLAIASNGCSSKIQILPKSQNGCSPLRVIQNPKSKI